MDFIYESLKSVMDALSVIPDFFNALPDLFVEFMAYINLWYLKLKFSAQIVVLRISYETALLLLKEIGFNTMLETLFNKLPSELRFYAFEFGFVDGITLYFNVVTTAFVMRMSNWS
ncbi:DUF2523 domain-containing protein [Vibrio sp. Of7-15]|uniref:DUF2523 domain-containing protein n=1 Tax=Vibrio sp. Of7-15 TaxID=2724879 RepID=UPI001EF3128F|nr:DUF2523 domain-containing protein [Vibrio sp. Of7-15]MCG7500065.1 DUF2523 domain-containing protein [Vibrio sp. Of7-15]